MPLRETFHRLIAIVVPGGWASVRGAAALAGALIGIFLLIAVLVAASVTAGLDADLWTLFDRLDRPGVVHLVIRFFYRFGQFVLVAGAVVAVSALVSLRERRWRPILVAGGAMGVLDALMLAFKYPLGRSYPHTGLNVVFGGSGESFQAFPSGHAAHATIGLLLLATLLSRLSRPAPRRTWWGARRWLVVLAGLLAFAAGLMNVVQGYHWMTDVVAGWVIGVAFFVLALALLGQGTGPGKAADRTEDPPGRLTPS